MLRIAGRDRNRRHGRRSGANPGRFKDARVRTAATLERFSLRMISRLTARADRRHRQLLVAAGKGAGIADAGVQRRGQPGEGAPRPERHDGARSEEHTSELQSLMRISYAVFCLKKKKTTSKKRK